MIKLIRNRQSIIYFKSWSQKVGKIAYVRWHSQHSNGRSLECVARCSFSSDNRGKIRPQSSHLCINRRRSMDPPPLVWMSCASVVVSSIFKSKKFFVIFFDMKFNIELIFGTYQLLDPVYGPPNVILRNFSSEIYDKLNILCIQAWKSNQKRKEIKMPYDLSQSGHS